MGMLQENEAQIKKAENSEGQAKNIVIKVTQAEQVVHVRPIAQPEYVYVADPDIRVQVLERERQEITEKVRGEYKKKLADMKINILAYQDLLLTKDDQIKRLEAQVRREIGAPDESASQTQIEELNKLLLEKQNIIEEL